MNLLRVYVVVLMVGWLVWLVIDKSPSAPVGPGPAFAPPSAMTQPFPLSPSGPPPRDPVIVPPREGDALMDFQYAVDMAKQGEFRQGFLVLWRRQYFSAAAIIAALLMFVLVPAFQAVNHRWRRGRRGGGMTPAREGRIREPDH